MLSCIDQLVAGRPFQARAQNSSLTSYAKKLSKKEAEIKWQEPADLIARKIRAFNPWPVAWTRLDGERLRIWSAVALQRPGGEPGQIIARHPQGIDVSCGDGCLRITEMQKSGGKRISAADYLNARH